MIHFDEMSCDRFSLGTDLTESVYIPFARKAKIPDDMDVVQALENLHLIRNGLMTYAGAWLLAADIQKFTVSGFVSCALFMGTSRVNILDRKNFTGSLQDIFQGVITWLLSKLNTEFIITSTGRDERPELPADALREALVNALVHRDYRSSANVQVHLYGNRVEIISPGGLPAGMKEEDIGLKSIPRNPLLFSMFYRMDLVEQIGSGIKRMRQLCRDYGVQEPVLRIEDNWVTIIFNRGNLQSGRESGVTPPQLPPPVERVLFSCEKPIDREEMQKRLGIKNKKYFLESYLQPALKSGFLEMTIPDKPNSPLQRYRLTELGRQWLQNKKMENES